MEDKPKMDISGFVKPWINGLPSYVPGKTKKGYIKLASNENNYGPCPSAVRAIKDNAPSVYIYPYKDDDLRGQIAGYCGVKTEEVVLGNGSDELIDLILKVFKGPCLGFNPSFSEYELCTRALGGDYFKVNLNPDFSFPAERFVAESEKAGILFLASPNNPTGTVIPEEDIKRVLDEGKITVVDEAYFEFYGKTVVPLIREYPNLIVLRTLSKAFGLAGLRVGYAVAQNPIIELLYKVKPPFNVNSLAHLAGVEALCDDKYRKMMVDKIKRDREELAKAFSTRWRVTPSQANFILVDSSPTKAGDFCKRLFEYGFIAREFGRFEGFEGEYTRVSVGTWEENQKLLSVIRKL